MAAPGAAVGSAVAAAGVDMAAVLATVTRHHVGAAPGRPLGKASAAAGHVALRRVARATIVALQPRPPTAKLAAAAAAAASSSSCQVEQ